MRATVKLRRGTSAQWAAKNPILSEGETGLDLSNGRIKIGDGKTPWNSLQYEGGESATTSPSQNLSFSNANGVTFGQNGSTITASVQTNYQSAGSYQSAFVFSNNGNVTFGIAGSVVSANAPVAGAASLNVSAGATSNNLSAITFSNSNGVTFGLTGSTLTASVKTDYQTSGNYLTTAALSQDSSKYAGTNGSIVGGSLTLNTSGATISLPAYLTTAMASDRGSDFVQATAGFAGTNASGTIASNAISVSVKAGFSQTLGMSNLGNTSGTTGVLSNGNIQFVFVGGNNVTLSQSLNVPNGGGSGTITFSVGNYITTAALSSQTLAFSLGGNKSTTNSSVISNGAFILAGGNNLTIQQSNNSVSLSVGNYITTGALSNQTLAFSLGGNSATTNSSQISNGGFVLAGGNNVTIQQSNNSVSISVGNYLTTADLSQNSSKYAGTGFTTTTNSGVLFAGTHDTSGLKLAVPSFTALMWCNVNNLVGLVSGAITNIGSSSIILAPMSLPVNASASYIRFLLGWNDSVQATAGTTANNSTYSCDRYTTFAAIIYTNTTGANSRSLQYLTSFSAGMTGRTIYGGGTNGSAYTISLQKSYPITGGTSSYTTSYAVSSASIVISSNSNTLFTGPRFLDIPAAFSLSSGVYWFGFGFSTNSATNSANISFCTANAIALALGVVTQGTNLSVGVLGAASSASDNQLEPGLGVWTTNSVILSTSSIAISQVSQGVSNNKPVVWLQVQQ